MVYIIGEASPMNTVTDIIGAIERDKKAFLMNGDKLGLSSCRLVLGEIQRDPNKDYSDDNVKKILRGLRKMTLKNPVPDTLLISLIDTYIPGPVADSEMFESLESMGFTKDTIKEMGKKAYSIMGIMKKFFDEREINSEGLKKYIDEAINE